MDSDDFELSDDSEEEYERGRRRDKLRDHRHLQEPPSLILSFIEGSLKSQKSRYQTEDVHHDASINPNSQPSIKRRRRTGIALQRQVYLYDFRETLRRETFFVCILLFVSLQAMLHFNYADRTTFTLNEGLNDEMTADEARLDSNEFYRNLADLYSTDGVDGTPFLWRQRGITSPLEDVFSNCFNAERIGLGDVDNLEDMEIIASDLKKNTIVSSNIHEMNNVFTSDNRGRLFFLMKHPTHNEVDRFLREFSTAMTVDQYIQSPYFVDNWMTRSLANKSSDQELTQEDLDFSMEVLSQKGFVGVFASMEEYIERLNLFFKWNLDDEQRGCCQFVSQQLYSTYMETPYPVEGSELWRKIVIKQIFDVQLFHFVESLFDDERQISLKSKD